MPQKNRRIHIRRLFSQLEFVLELLSSSAVSGNSVSSNGVNLCAVNHSDRVCINSLSLSGLVTTRSERNSCNSYEHQN